MAAITVKMDSWPSLDDSQIPFVGIHTIASAKRFKGLIRLETEREHPANRATRKPRAEDVGDGLLSLPFQVAALRKPLRFSLTTREAVLSDSVIVPKWSIRLTPSISQPTVGTCTPRWNHECFRQRSSG